MEIGSLLSLFVHGIREKVAPPWLEMVLAVVAALCGLIVGAEREKREKPAGLHTLTLVCLGSASYTMVSYAFITTSGDAGRIAAQIVTGIGFLGAGVIVKEGFTVRGLTTAASIWVVSAIGIAFGAGALLAGTIGVALTLGALSLLRTVEDRLHVQLYARCRVAFRRQQRHDETWLRAFVERYGFVVTELSYRLDSRDDTLEYGLVMYSSNPQSVSLLGHALLADDSVADFTISPSRD
jgi:putative Mg2+ transporter-C (MgtC) family protein